MKQHDPLPFQVEQVGAVPFHISDLTAAQDWLIGTAIPGRIITNVRLANSYNVALASRDAEYAELLRSSGVNFPDGAPVAWMLRRITRSKRAMQVRGPTLFLATLEKGTERGIRNFFLGSTPVTLDLLESTLFRRFPGILVVGKYSPPYSELNDNFLDRCVDEVVRAKPDVVWVGLGTPKQDFVGTAIAARCGIPAVNVGAAFDFLAGTVQEAPRWLQGSGLEWMFRLLIEPRRLWRRYLYGNSRFILISIAMLARRRSAAKKTGR